MALIEVYIGNPQAISIKNRISTGVYENLDDFIEIIVYITSGKNSLKTIKFSKTSIAGYSQLERVNEFQYVAKLTRANQKFLGCADVFISCDFRDSLWTSNDENNKLSGEYLFTLVNIPVSAEL